MSDDLAAARGIAIGLVFSFPFWFAVVGIWRWI